MARSIQPFLMFDGQAEAAMNLYVSLFSDGAVIDIVRYGDDGEGDEGSVKTASFSIAGQVVRCIDSSVHHSFGFTPAFSLFVECEDDSEIERVLQALSEDGEVLMPLDDYGFGRFAWVNDRFGVSWQVRLRADV